MPATTQFDSLLQELSNKYDVNADLLQKLIALESTKAHLERRPGVKELIRKIVEDWLEEQSQ